MVAIRATRVLFLQASVTALIMHIHTGSANSGHVIFTIIFYEHHLLVGHELTLFGFGQPSRVNPAACNLLLVLAVILELLWLVHNDIDSYLYI